MALTKRQVERVGQLYGLAMVALADGFVRFDARRPRCGHRFKVNSGFNMP